MIFLLTWIGARARWVLLIGAFAGLAFPAGAAALRPFLPYITALVYAVAMLRIDPIPILRELITPHRALRLLGLTSAIMIISPTLAWLVARALGLDHAFTQALVYTFAAPPIASAAAMCLIIGFQGRIALQLSVLSAFAMPFAGPFIISLLLGQAMPLDPLILSLRIAAMIFGGFILAMIGRRLLGEARIARNTAALDGVAALAFLCFVLPIFDGVGPTILARPWLSLAFLGLSFLLVCGAVIIALRLPGAAVRNGAYGVIFGTRSVAIYMAALPPEPVFTLFVALYQLPMAGLVILFRRR